MTDWRRFTWPAAGSIVLAAALNAGAISNGSDNGPGKDAKDQDARPKLSLRAEPLIAMAPARIVLTAQLTGGANDFEEFYCPAVAWVWGDGTTSESSSDCDPYQAGKSEIRRRYTVEHVFSAGNFRVSFVLKLRNKTLVTASTNIQIRPGIHDAF